MVHNQSILKMTASDEFVFVENSSTIEHTGTNILTPFDQASGALQSITVTIGGESESILYDETTNEIQTSEGVIGIGGYFLLGGHKVKVQDI